MPTRKFFLSAGWLQVLAETMGFAALLLGILLAASSGIPDNALSQAALLLSLLSGLWAAVRLKLPRRIKGNQLLREAVFALGLVGSLGGLLPGLIVLIGWGSRLASATLRAVGMSLALGANGLVFAGGRVLVRLWIRWDRLRRTRLLWSLTHAHLVVIVSLVVLVSLLAGGQIAGSVIDQPERFLDQPLAAVVDLVTRTVFPFAAVVLVILGGLLVVLLPPTAVFSYFVARRTTRRLSDLAGAARALQDGNLSARSPVSGEDEVAQLQEDFNRMARDQERMTSDLAEERDKVSQLLVSRRELFANVSHELRTPVATLKGILESALKEELEAPEELSRDLEVMDGAVDRLQRLIEDLFVLSRAEVNALELSLQAVDLEPLVHGQAAAFSKLAWDRSRVELAVEVPTGLDAVRVDPDRLEQVLANLLRNAVRHTPPGGIVAVRAAEIEDGVELEVCDTGPGIPPEELPRIWDRFYRGEGARQAEPGGAGLGLALVQELTEAMGGRVSVQSRADEGSCFRLLLPKA